MRQADDAGLKRGKMLRSGEKKGYGTTKAKERGLGRGQSDQISHNHVEGKELNGRAKRASWKLFALQEKTQGVTV